MDANRTLSQLSYAPISLFGFLRSSLHDWLTADLNIHMSPAAGAGELIATAIIAIQT